MMRQSRTIFEHVVESKRIINTLPLLIIALWLLVGINLNAAIPDAERTALIALYDSMGGDSWTDHTNWKGATGTENTWYGVTVENVDGTDHVTKLHLHQNNLSGAIPDTIGNLTYLNELWLFENNITGAIPPQIGNLKGLVELNLSNNKISGNIPTEIGNLLKLHGLYLTDNQLTGTIPAGLGNSTNLRWVALNRNKLTGSIPPEVFSRHFISLDVSYNQLSGQLTKDFFNAIGMGYLLLNHNRFSGTIPPEIGNIDVTERFDISGNNFVGIIPTEIKNVYCDHGLYIDYNGLYSSSQEVIDYLARYSNQWRSNQTIAPQMKTPDIVSSNSVRINWTPISYQNDPGGYCVYYSTNPGGPFSLYAMTPTKQESSLLVTGLNTGVTYYFKVKTITYPHVKNDNSIESNFSETVNAIPAGELPKPPEISLNRPNLQFGACLTGNKTTESQSISIENKGEGTLNWTAAANESWISVTPASRIGNGSISISVNTNGLDIGQYSGTVNITDPNAVNSPQTIQVNLKITQSGEQPFGEFSTPINGAAVSSSIPVTGWALDDLGQLTVKIYRAPVEGEGNDKIWIGDAVFVEGMRPDVSLAYSSFPLNYRAGWGYMLLTNMLPNQGNGVFTLYAIATDAEGHSVTLGTKTITADNEHAVKPFGAIDTPMQGETISGDSFLNFGWVLAKNPNMIPIDGSTIDVWIDGVKKGNVTYNIFREDIAGLFPGYLNTEGAGGYFYFDSTLLSNSIHTIQWTVSDNAGNTDGIGSRYFNVMNETPTPVSPVLTKNTIQSIPGFSPISIKKGYNENTIAEEVMPNDSGVTTIRAQEMERLEISFPHFDLIEGYISQGTEPKPLPAGSTLDVENDLFYWQPGPGFVGTYHLVFIGKNPENKFVHKDITITFTPETQENKKHFNNIENKAN